MNDNTEKIIEAAYMKFMDKGYKATKTAEIAEAANINESTLFRNFKNKENLFQASIEFYLKKAMTVDFDIMYYTNDLEKDLHRMIETIFQLSLELIPSFRLLVKVSLVKAEILENIEQEIVQQKNLFSHYLQGMLSRNMIKEVDTSTLIEFIYSTIFVSAFDYLIKKSDHDEIEIIEKKVTEITNTFVELLRGGEYERNN